MDKMIYLDNSATTALSAPVKEKIREAMEIFGNPSSLHAVGNAAHDLLEESRRQVAQSLGIRSRLQPGELIFTSCGSEADGIALLGSAYAKPRRKGMRIISSDSEHPAVEQNLRKLENDGFEIVRISTRHGVFDMDAYEKALEGKVFLVSVMAVNNETGAAYDLEKIFALAKAKNPEILTHTDAVQGYLKEKLTPASVHADMISISGHKIHAPKGIGALYIAPELLKRKDVVPQLLGGGQEFGFRSGTENTLGIAALGEAAKQGSLHLEENIAKMEALRQRILTGLSSLPVTVNLPAGRQAPHIVSVTLPNLRSETVLHELSRNGICISNGSACSSHASHPSSALQAFGLSAEDAGSTIRVSLSEENSESDADAFLTVLRETLDRLVKIRR